MFYSLCVGTSLSLEKNRALFQLVLQSMDTLKMAENCEKQAHVKDLGREALSTVRDLSNHMRSAESL